jgi:hydroxymethylbilane synthase
MRRVRIGTRGSILAMWQANHIAEQLAKLGVETEIVQIKTSGDRFQSAGINQIGVKGVFIKEIEDALLDGRVDIAVHSMKDVPTEIPKGLLFPAMCERSDPRDCLISRDGKKLAELPQGARIGTSSLRRQAQLRHARPDLSFVELRGNVDTRLRKLEQGQVDAIALAKAGMDRLGWSGRITEVLEAKVCLPAAGQGVLGIESRETDTEIAGVVGQLDHSPTRLEVAVERAVLRELQGGCQVPLGVRARLKNEGIVVDACIASADGSQCLREHSDGCAVEDEQAAGELGKTVARSLLAAGAGKILRLAGRQGAG